MICNDDQFEHNVYYSKIQTHEGICEDLQLQLILTNTNTKDTSSQNVSFYLKDEEAREQGLQTLNKYHCQLLNKNVYNQLYNGGYTPEVCEFVSKLFPNDIEKARLILYLTRNLAMNLSGVETIIAIFEELNVNPNNYISLIKKVATKNKVNESENILKTKRRGRKAKTK